MRRLFILLLCCVLLTGAVFADNRTNTVRNTTTIFNDGSAHVSLSVSVTLEEPQEGLTFPIPRDADDVVLNGNPVQTSPSRVNDSVDLVELTHLDGVTGTYTLSFSYVIPAVVSYDEATKDSENRQLVLNLPLLSGFEYPVESMTFSVALPEGVDGIPSFYSGYFLQSIESDLDYTFEEGVISGTVTEPMKDKETLMMTMPVTQAQFPDLVIIENEENLHLYAMAALAGIAWLFWLVFLPSLPVFGKRRNTPPAGVHAGSLGSWLTMEGGDLTMMVFQWAQLGYLRIVPDKRGRVWLHKRMEMGNERSAFEVKCFNKLFGRNRSVEGTGSRYGRLWHSVRGTVERREEILIGGTGARGVFRFLAMLVSVLAGAAMGSNFIPEEGTMQTVMMVMLALVGGYTAWKIQAGPMRLHLRQREALPGCLICCAVWLLVSLVADRPIAGLASTLVQLLAGLFAAWSGRRTKSGRQTACKVLGLRHYLTGIKRDEVKDELNKNPDYFFEMVPFAMAFGAENAFARRFGSRILPQCSYLEADRASKRTAREWAVLMRQTAAKLDAAGKKANTYRKR